MGATNQNTWNKLGWNRRNWDGPESGYPQTFHTDWKDLNSNQRKVVESLGYDQKTWDETLPNGDDARRSGKPNDYWNNYEWSQIGPTEQGLWRVLGWNTSNWDDDDTNDPPTVNQDYRQLTSRQQEAVILLGYDQRTWDAD